jgi:hypothetical protein
MQAQKLISAIMTVSIIAAAGCVSPGRLADLKDCGRASVGIGSGLLVDVELGCLTKPSFGGVARTRRVGIDSRDSCGRWEENEIGSPLVQFLIPIREAHPLWSYARDPGEPKDEAGYWLPPLTRKSRTFHGVAPHWSFHNSTDLSAGITAGFASARLGVNPLEFLDFTLGYAGLDIGRDDPEPEAPTEKTTVH